MKLQIIYQVNNALTFKTETVHEGTSNVRERLLMQVRTVIKMLKIGYAKHYFVRNTETEKKY